MERLPRKMRCRRFLRGTRAGLKFDLRYLARLSRERVRPNPKVMSAVMPLIPYLDSAQYYFCTLMNRAARAKRVERYREAEAHRNEVVMAIVNLLTQPDYKSLSRWVGSNYGRLMSLIPEAQREEAAWDLQNLYLFPILKS